MPFTIALKRKKYLGVNLTKNVIKTCILKTVKTLTKKIDEDTSKWKDSLCSWTRTLLKCPYPKQYTD